MSRNGILIRLLFSYYLGVRFFGFGLDGYTHVMGKILQGYRFLDGDSKMWRNRIVIRLLFLTKIWTWKNLGLR